MKENIFVGQKITQLFEDQNFSTKLNATERRVWKEFENVCRKFRGDEKAENSTEKVQELISPDSDMGCNMSLKVLPLEFFSENIGTLSDELDEMFHQIIPQIEQRRSGKWNPNMLADYCWSLIGETPNGEYKRPRKMKCVNFMFC